MHGRRRSLKIFVAAGVAALAGGALAIVPGAPAGATTFPFFTSTGPGAATTNAVPVNVCFVTITADGGHGGGSDATGGGDAAHVVARVPVTPGATLTVLVGGLGGDGGTSDPFAGGVGGVGGGGDGAQGGGSTNGGGGGGGASAVSVGGAPLVVAGGGGGAAEAFGFGGAGGPGGQGSDAGNGIASGFGGPDGVGGFGGKGTGAGGNGAAATDGGGGGSTVGTPGSGAGNGGTGGTGTGTFGGGGGGGGAFSTTGTNGGNGSAGGFGGGGAAGDVDSGNGGSGNIGIAGGGGGAVNGGGAGGGGYGGGGGAGFASGGGGGSSFVTATATGTPTYGVSLGGDGQVAITYDDTTDLCPVTPPSAPTNVSAYTGNGQVTVFFSPPVSTGSGPITGYKITCGAQPPVVVGPAKTSAVVTGLANGTPVTCNVRAKNAAAGYGPATVSNSVTPGVPIGPSSVTGGPGPITGSVVVNWNAALNNGSPVNNYLVTCTPWSPSFPTRFANVGGSARSVQLNNLAPGQQHNCTIVASNMFGAGNPQNAQPPGNVVPKS